MVVAEEPLEAPTPVFNDWKTQEGCVHPAPDISIREKPALQRFQRLHLRVGPAFWLGPLLHEVHLGGAAPGLLLVGAAVARVVGD